MILVQSKIIAVLTVLCTVFAITIIYSRCGNQRCSECLVVVLKSFEKLEKKNNESKNIYITNDDNPSSKPSPALP